MFWFVCFLINIHATVQKCGVSRFLRKLSFIYQRYIKSVKSDSFFMFKIENVILELANMVLGEIVRY